MNAEKSPLRMNLEKSLLVCGHSRPHLALQSLPRDREMILRFIHGERCMMMGAWEDCAASPRVDPRTYISTRDINAFLQLAIDVPLDGDAMSGVFGSKPPRQRNQSWSDVLQSNETDSTGRAAVLEFWAKRCGQNSSHLIRGDVEVRKYASIDDATNDGDSHSGILIEPCVICPPGTKDSHTDAQCLRRIL